MNSEKREVVKRFDINEAVVERRAGFEIDRIEQRDDGGVVLRGYASVFDSPSRWLGFREVVQRGAFSNSLDSGSDVKALVEHDPGRIVARTQNGTLTLGEDKTGLWVKVSPVDTTEGRDLVEAVRSGLLSQMSIGFRVLEERWSYSNNEELRTLTEVDLVEVSVVSEPAYQSTSILVDSRSETVEDDTIENTDVEQPTEPPPFDNSALRAKIELLAKG